MTNQIPSVLQKIVATKQQEVATAKATKPLAELVEQVDQQLTTGTHPRRGFANALRQAKTDGKVGIIAEVKKASPSKGIISQNFDPVFTAQGYEQAGASCLSVLTDREYFKGDDDYLVQARNACKLPALRKDFMIDEYQIYESYLLGADCILLIMACLDDEQVSKLHALTCKLGMDVLIEVHTANELERALKLPVTAHNIYGINNRDLNTFEVDLEHSIQLKDRLLAALDDTALVVSESGIHTADDINLMQKNGISTFLIGEQFMKTGNPGERLAQLLTEV